jgi:hypothetical protein
VRSYEVEHVGALWHLDFHHGSRRVLTHAGQWIKPLALCVMDDRLPPGVSCRQRRVVRRTLSV